MLVTYNSMAGRNLKLQPVGNNPTNTDRARNSKMLMELEWIYSAIRLLRSRLWTGTYKKKAGRPKQTRRSEEQTGNRSGLTWIQLKGIAQNRVWEKIVADPLELKRLSQRK